MKKIPVITALLLNLAFTAYGPGTILAEIVH